MTQTNAVSPDTAEGGLAILAGYDPWPTSKIAQVDEKMKLRTPPLIALSISDRELTVLLR
jgi:hypothetical protein